MTFHIENHPWNMNRFAPLRYKSPQIGLAESEVVEGADRDLPLTTIPSRPIVEPFNELIVAYLSSELVAGYQYGIKTKIRVPRNTPTASSNVFIIEFGFDETTLTGRSEVGRAKNYVARDECIT